MCFNCTYLGLPLNFDAFFNMRLLDWSMSSAWFDTQHYCCFPGPRSEPSSVSNGLIHIIINVSKVHWINCPLCPLHSQKMYQERAVLITNARRTWAHTASLSSNSTLMVGTARPNLHYCPRRHSLMITGAMGAVRVNRYEGNETMSADTASTPFLYFNLAKHIHL